MGDRPLCIITHVVFVRLFPLVCFQMPPQMACMERGIVTLVAFVRFFPTATVSLCVLNESSNWMPERKHKHTGCICSAFLRYVSSSDPTQIACMRRCMLTFAAVAWLSHTHDLALPACFSVVQYLIQTKLNGIGLEAFLGPGISCAVILTIKYSEVSKGPSHHLRSRRSLGCHV